MIIKIANKHVKLKDIFIIIRLNLSLNIYLIFYQNNYSNLHEIKELISIYKKLNFNAI